VAEPLRLTRLVKTCSMFPAQWEGRFEDGSHFYARWRGGWFYAGRGEFDKDAAVSPENGQGEFLANRDDLPDGDDMDTARMLDLLDGIVRFWPVPVDPDAVWAT
jgi:hypothetical protein